MREYVLTLLVAATVTYILTPLVRRGAIRVGALHEARDRDVHVVPIPLLGGLAMYGGLAAGLLVATQLTPLNSVFASTGPLDMESGLLLAGGLIVAIGVVDDRWGMNAISKLAGQVAAGAILVASGCELGWLPLPGGGTFSPTFNQATVLTILVVVATINAVNFIDGLDGLAAGIVGIASISFFLYYYSLTHVLRLTAEAGPALASAVLAGMCLGFLPHNFFPARIFMGDTGSMLLGLLLAYAPISSISSLDPLTLTSQQAYRIGTVNRFPEILPLLLPTAILVIPYADMLMAVVRRTRAGMSPFAPDRKHLHHRLLDIGHSHRLSVLIMYLWAAMFSALVVWLSIAKRPSWVFATITLGAVLALLLMSMPRLRWWERQRRRDLALAGGAAQAGGGVQAGGAAQAGAQAGQAAWARAAGRSGAGSARAGGHSRRAVPPGDSRSMPVGAPVPADELASEQTPAADQPAPGSERMAAGPMASGPGPGEATAPGDRWAGAGPLEDRWPADDGTTPAGGLPGRPAERWPADGSPALGDRSAAGPEDYWPADEGAAPGGNRACRSDDRWPAGGDVAPGDDWTAQPDAGLGAPRSPADPGADPPQRPRSVVGTIPPAVFQDTMPGQDADRDAQAAPGDRGSSRTGERPPLWS